MQAQTQASLNQCQAYLRDCLELAHLQLKQKLEAFKRGEAIDWKETRDVAREGRAAARQLQQIAALEVRDAKGAAQPQRKRRFSDVKLKKEPTPELMIRFVNEVVGWQTACAKAGAELAMPKTLRDIVVDFGLDPDDEVSFEVLNEKFDVMAEVQRAA